MSKLDDIELRSEEVQDILTAMPHWMVRWGNILLLIIIVLLFVFSWFIRYPDIVQTEIIITTQIPPEKLVANSTGKIAHIFISDKGVVTPHTPLAIIENPANYKDVYALKNLIETLDINNLDFNFPIEEASVLQLGGIESAYANFEKSYLEFSINKNLKPYLIDKQAQNFEQIQEESRLQLLLEQKEIASKELTYKRTELERHKKLFDKGVIPAQEWESKNVEYLQQEKNINSLTSQITNIRSSLNDLNKSKKTTLLSESKDDLILKRNVILAINQLKKSILDWELAYVIQASIEGKVTFLQIWKENQNITAGDNVFVIIPENNNFIGKVKATALNSGKIKVGQRVNIRLANYPDREFGIVQGEVKSFSLIPDKENNLLIDIDLPKGLKSSYNKELLFQQEMSGTADIITDDLRLIERLLYQFRDLFKRD
ncbi:HlyD family secretion protein [Myroides odoratus]|uniref:Hemolysin secretion protein D, chromosomal n=1 Tax=Myroides odoratus TaxID=256 RepID=A0A378RL79_MYROD|nr:HlyD family efflux transporter periplasmic adaptor subunit [Myroides odoratus]QQU04741.1 HlyD family efflux transporter periplasmic adaptor subunit [Myroides odoratus]STZ27813.1 Hemolysin secretion protein D, chromosomal [Myroides odoratus]